MCVAVIVAKEGHIDISGLRVKSYPELTVRAMHNVLVIRQFEHLTLTISCW